MTLLFRAPPGLSFFDCGGVRLMLSLPEGAEAPKGNSILYYGVDDIKAAHEVLVARGRALHRRPTCRGSSARP
jgi:methylmalonyl-CoA/ethylmalonyl-CoA epimerase